MTSTYSLYLIPPVLSLITAYILAVVSITRKKLNSENILLSLICIWWSLLSWAFIWHNIETDETVIMSAERIIHTIYVYVPALSLLFFQKITGSQNRPLLYGTFILSTAISFLVHTDLYFYGFHYYSWGMIAKGGPVFHLFSLYGTAITLYIFYLFINKLKSEKNRVVRLKINYLAISYFLSVLLTISNIPAMNGIDFYPLSNLMFIPLGIMTYGILRYRLINISSVVHYSVFWLILSSLIAIPNLLVFLHIQEMFSKLSSFLLIIIFLIWFVVNYFYFNKIQPVINRLINKRSFNLRETEKIFLRDLALLKNLDDLIHEVINIMLTNLELSHASIFLRGLNRRFFSSENNTSIEIDDSALNLLSGHGEIYLQKSILESGVIIDPAYTSIASLLADHNSEYLIPLINQNELIAIILLSEKKDSRQFNGNEFRFIRNISTYAGIAIANSVMFRNLEEINNHLELIVEERTAVIEKQKSELERDVQFARKIQMSLLPKNIPMIKRLKIAYRYEPVLGVGGDFIDIHYREGMDDVGLFICDVSGHGASSAMIASMVKMSLNSWGRFIQKPAEAFVEMKRLLYGKIGDNFISAYMCSINLKTGIITSACAGHPPMIIIRKNGGPELIKPGGRLILDAADATYEEVHTPLYPGDMIVLYTDGVIEARTATGEMIGEERFVEMLNRYSGLSSYTLCSRIYDEIFNNSDATVIDDDFALLVAEYTGE